MVACSLGQCMAGLCRSFGAYIACQGLIFGIGMNTKIMLHTVVGPKLMPSGLGLVRLSGEELHECALTELFFCADFNPIATSACTLVQETTEFSTGEYFGILNCTDINLLLTSRGLLMADPA